MAFWIWVGFGDVPAVHALVGGALVIGAGGRRYRGRHPFAPIFMSIVLSEIGWRDAARWSRRQARPPR